MFGRNAEGVSGPGAKKNRISRIKASRPWKIMNGIRNTETLMAQTSIQHVVDRLRESVEVEQTLDGGLLDAFVGERSETAFAELVRRHGPMVYGKDT